MNFKKKLFIQGLLLVLVGSFIRTNAANNLELNRTQEQSDDEWCNCGKCLKQYQYKEHIIKLIEWTHIKEEVEKEIKDFIQQFNTKPSQTIIDQVASLRTILEQYYKCVEQLIQSNTHLLTPIIKREAAKIIVKDDHQKKLTLEKVIATFSRYRDEITGLLTEIVNI